VTFAYPNLCKELDAKGITLDILTERLNIPKNTLCDKLGGNTPWTLPEAISICQSLNNSDVKYLFYS